MKKMLLSAGTILLGIGLILPSPRSSFAQITIDLNIQSAGISARGDEEDLNHGIIGQPFDLNQDGCDEFIIFCNAKNGVGDVVGEIEFYWGGTIFPSELTRPAADMIIRGEQIGQWSGLVVKGGDLNHDGLTDLVVNTRRLDTGNGTNSGGAYVFLGRENWPALIDLGTENADLEIIGANEYDECGRGMDIADVNADGYDDIVLGAHCEDPNPPACQSKNGIVYIIFGDSTMPSSIDLGSSSADVTIYGKSFHDYLGSTIESGDVNGDGKEDIFVGSPLADPLGRTWAGMAHLFYGKTVWPATINLGSTNSDVTIYGVTNDNIAYHLDVNDMTGDGTPDLLMSAYRADPNGTDSGRFYLVEGSGSLAATIDLNSGSYDLRVDGGSAEDWLGNAIRTGDVNGDGIADMVIGVPHSGETATDPPEVYVFYGSNSLPSDIDLSLVDPDIILIGHLGGWSGKQPMVGTGDLNFDGVDDLIMGETLYDSYGISNAGAVWVIFGAPAPVANLRAYPIGGGKLALEWEKSYSNNVSQYVLYWDDGTGTIDYGTPLATFPHPLTTYITGVLTNGTEYLFDVRPVGINGIESAREVIASAVPYGSCSQPKAEITVPHAGKKVGGQRITVVARLSADCPSDASQVEFEYREAGGSTWSLIPAANTNHPNPDTTVPYFVHWDVSGFGNGDYYLRAVASDQSSIPDPDPATIMITIDHQNPASWEGACPDNCFHQRREHVYQGKSNLIQIGRWYTGQAVDSIEIPEGGLNRVTDTVLFTYEYASSHPGKCPEGKICSMREFREILLLSGAACLAGGKTATVKISYRDDDNDGVLDDAKIGEQLLEAYRWISDTEWQRLASSVDKQNNVVTFTTSCFSTFSLAASEPQAQSCGGGGCGGGGGLALSSIMVAGFLLRRKRIRKT